MRTDVDKVQAVNDSADSNRVLVKELQITGAQSIAAEELLRISGFVPGSAYSLSELRGLAAKITAYYRSQGFFLTQTYLPTQDATEGLVRLAVVEGQYGHISLQNRSALSDGVAHAMLNGLHSGDAVTSAGLDRSILLLSDLPGVLVKSVMGPGAAVGSTNLSIDLTPGARVSGGLEADNQGNRYTGSNRFGANITINEPTGLGDVATARVLTSGQGLAYGRVSYQMQLGSVSAGLAYTDMTYQLGEEFASTQSSGTARIAGVYASYPFIRSRTGNLSLQLSYDNKDLSDKTGSGPLGSTSDKTAQDSTASLKGDFHDSWGNGFNNYMLSWTRGDIHLQNPAVVAIDSVTAQSGGTFDKLVYGFTRQQDLTANTALYVSIYGQLASKNLDASEKISLGGAGGVRAYPSGEATGDEGLVMTLETRTRWAPWGASLPGQLQWIAFVDAGMVTLNKKPWDINNPPNSRKLNGAGFGLNYVSTGNWMVKASCAFKLGDEVAVSAPDAASRIWLQANKAF